MLMRHQMPKNTPAQLWYSISERDTVVRVKQAIVSRPSPTVRDARAIEEFESLFMLIGGVGS